MGAMGAEVLPDGAAPLPDGEAPLPAAAVPAVVLPAAAARLELRKGSGRG